LFKSGKEDEIRRTVSETTAPLPGRRELLKCSATAILLLASAIVSPFRASANGFLIINRFSPLNKKRPRRPSTRYIVLHTTEGEDAGSLRKIVRYGEAHYVIGSSGLVCRVIDRNRIATHAGRSMWDGRSTIDNYSIGIEVVGYHNEDITSAQYAALRELLRQLKGNYKIADRNIVTHSMVAYGRPNRFHRSNHRGRKRCGMLFARPDVRARLGLDVGPEKDPDVEGGRLKVADSELFAFLFVPARQAAALTTAGARGTAAPPVPVPTESNIIDRDWTAWKIARERYNHPSTTYVLPNGSRLSGNEIDDWNRIPAGTRVLLQEGEDTEGFEGFLEIGKDGDTPQALAGDDFASSTAIYFFPDGYIRTGAELHRRASTRDLLSAPPKGTRLLVGYIYGGYVRTRRPPSSIAGVKWNYPSTYYRLPDGSIVSGDGIDDRAIPAGTLVFYQH
jgi:hypothetical protein